MKNNGENAQKMDKIMGIKVNSTSLTEVLTRVKDFISHSTESDSRNTKFYIVTPNPELILASIKDNKLKKILNNADISIPDGIGLIQAVKYNNLWCPNVFFVKQLISFFQGIRVGLSTFIDRKWLTREFKPIKGRELFLDLINLSVKNNWRIFLLGGLDNEAEISSKKLRVKYDKLQIEYDKGPKLNIKAKPITQEDVEIEKKVINKINKFAPQLLFVAFGNPRQEIWIYEHLSKLKIGGAMCVGGTFRYIAGTSKLPPKWMAGIGLEWLWRLITEPKRIGRVFKAVVFFPFKFWMSKLG